ncbi:S49 family peptidase [Aeoliella mucimassa]|uniref:Putative protease SohB n=1 Tax=Aeoliella mucimassa TaxID=2527972 RepID=A0A518ARM8_9BACT|nr:S49 family peptidase [Aeoliella mucimassa]QDU57379.1 putative protease SohB [Aeoliella mucimassa]QDU57926.1 putative protease SohB [Aeoliella mucimassa]
MKHELAAVLPAAAAELQEALAISPTHQVVRFREDSKLVATCWVEGVLTPWYLERVRERLYSILRNDAVGHVIIRMSSPGGLVAGVPETADLVREFSEAKAVTVIASEYLASAAYWIASQATTIIASPSTVVGSVGVISVLTDSSAAYEAAGIKVIPVASANAKHRGMPGVPVTEGDIEAVRAQVEEVSRWFLQYINRVPPKCSRRRMTSDQVLNAISAETYYAEEALKRGFVDEVAAPEQAIAAVLANDKHADLRGKDAYDKYAELALAAHPGVDFLADLSESQEAALRRKYPTLAEAADDYRRLH